jgi:hypothetical protein
MCESPFPLVCRPWHYFHRPIPRGYMEFFLHPRTMNAKRNGKIRRHGTIFENESGACGVTLLANFSSLGPSFFIFADTSVYLTSPSHDAGRREHRDVVGRAPYPRPSSSRSPTRGRWRPSTFDILKVRYLSLY